MTDSRSSSTAAGVPLVPHQRRAGHSHLGPFQPGASRPAPALARHALTRSQEITFVNFGGLSIALDGLVPAPLPWTIAQAMWAAELAVHAPAGPILALSCGVGHIGLLAAKVSERDLLLVDTSPRATAFAERNATTAELHGQFAVRCGELEDVVSSDGPFALILADLSRELVAGDAKADELRLARRVLGLIKRHLAPHGSAIVQVARNSQADSVAQALVEGEAPALRVADMEVYRRGVLLEVVHTD